MRRLVRRKRLVGFSAALASDFVAVGGYDEGGNPTGVTEAPPAQPDDDAFNRGAG